MTDMEEDRIIMTPSKKDKTTHIKIERKRMKKVDNTAIAHVAGGQHSGLVVNKQAEGQEDPDLTSKPQLQLGFTCFMIDAKTQNHLVESRKLRFWYIDDTDYLDQVTTAYEFFKELVRPENFPRDYTGFIKKCMKQMQDGRYYQAKKILLDIQQLDHQDAPMSPSQIDELGSNKVDNRSNEEIVREKLLTILESAYPNILTIEDLVRITAADEVFIRELLMELKMRELVKEMENGGFVRLVLDNKTEVQMVKQMPTIASNQQPTVAIITAMYYEKLAVDAMMENKTTYMRYKTEGESNVYTIGYIGEHKVVSTKLPAIGQHRTAQISSGNTTTRLLGTFQNVDHVFLVGVAGGVPHYTNFYKHVRLGDVVVSHCDNNRKIYYYCNKILQDKGDSNLLHYVTKSWSPKELTLEKLAEQINKIQASNPDFAPWEKYIEEGQQLMYGQEVNFTRPDQNTDHLYMDVGDNNVIEVDHPQAPDGVVYRVGVPHIYHGVFGAGRPNARSDTTRLDFATKFDVRAYDSEFDQVLESIDGNRKDSFMIIRGVADYTDGAKHKEWQPYAAIAAAAYMKTIIKALSNPQIEEY